MEKLTNKFDLDSKIIVLWDESWKNIPYLINLPEEYSQLEIKYISLESHVNGIAISAPCQYSYFYNYNTAKWEKITEDTFKDSINSPSHYKQGNIEVFDFIEDQKMNYTEGAIIKYISRYKYKGKPLEDLQKAAWYLNKLIEKEKNVSS